MSPKSDSDESDSLDLDEVGEKSLWVLRGGGKEQSLRVSRSLRTKELEALRRENKDLKKQADDREAEGQKQIASLTQQLEVCQPQHTTYQVLNFFRIWYGFQF